MEIIRKRVLELIDYINMLQGANPLLVSGDTLPSIWATRKVYEAEAKASYEQIMLLKADSISRSYQNGEREIESQILINDWQEKWLSFRDAEFKFLDALQKKAVISQLTAEKRKTNFIGTRKYALALFLQLAEVQDSNFQPYY